MNNNFRSYKKVIVPAKHRFFGEDNEKGVEAYLTEFEPNSIISKGLTGCGATTILLENNQPMILSCPTNELCHDKSTAQRHAGKVMWYNGHAGINIQCPPEQIDHLPPVKMVGFRRSKLTTL